MRIVSTDPTLTRDFLRVIWFPRLLPLQTVVGAFAKSFAKTPPLALELSVLRLSSSTGAKINSTALWYHATLTCNGSLLILLSFPCGRAKDIVDIALVSLIYLNDTISAHQADSKFFKACFCVRSFYFCRGRNCQKWERYELFIMEGDVKTGIS